jgi:hypothetical protein
MRRILTVLFIAAFGSVNGQNAIIGSGFSTGWLNPTNITFMDQGAGTSRILFRNPNGTGNQFFRMVTGWDNNNNTEWGPGNVNDLELTSGVPASVVTANSTKAYFINCPNTTDNYIFKTRGGGNPPATPSLVVFRVEGTVRTVSSVTSSLGTVYPAQANTITANLSGSFAAGQGVYLRYTTNNFASSTIVEMIGSGTTYTAAIPSNVNTPGAVVRYYIFTSGSGLTIAHGDADFFTINLNNNAGSNYSYTVQSSYASVAAGNWSNTATWNAGVVPPASQPITIGHNVNVDGEYAASSVVVNTGATLTVDAGQSLSMTGGVTGAGNFVVNGILRLNAGGFTSIIPSYGAGTSQLTYNTGGQYNAINEWPATASPASIRIINSNVDLTGNRNITGVLTIESGGVLRVNGHTLTLKASSAADYSQLLNLGTLTGNITFERTITGTTAGWRFLSPAVTGGNLSNLGTVQLNGAANVIRLNTANPNAWVAQGGATTDALTAGRGYGLYFGTDGINNNTVATTVALSGAIVNNDVTVSGLSDGNNTNNFGWTLVGNPFPTSMEWDNNNHTKTNIADAYYVWDAANGVYASFVNGISSPQGALTNNIPPAQGFIVKATAATPVLTFSAQARTTGSQSARLRTSNAPNLISLKVRHQMNQLWDETVLVNENASSNQFDASFDAYKINSFNADAINLSSISADGFRLSINSSPAWSASTIIPLNLQHPASAAMSITADLSQWQSMGLQAVLFDNFLNVQHDLGQGAYSFVYQPGQVNRFEVRFAAATTSIAQVNQAKVLLYAHESTLYVNGLDRAESLTVSDLSGRVVMTVRQPEFSTAGIKMLLPTGIYVVQVRNEQGVHTSKVKF